MGAFLEPEVAKAKAFPQSQGVLQSMETEDIDDLFVIPAEKLIAESCNLGLNTDGNPWRWQGRFESSTDGARLLAEYQAAYRRATILVVNSMAANPLREITKSVKSASTAYPISVIPPAAKALMEKWSAPRRIFRS